MAPVDIPMTCSGVCPEPFESVSFLGVETWQLKQRLETRQRPSVWSWKYVGFQCGEMINITSYIYILINLFVKAYSKTWFRVTKRCPSFCLLWLQRTQWQPPLLNTNHIKQFPRLKKPNTDTQKFGLFSPVSRKCHGNFAAAKTLTCWKSSTTDKAWKSPTAALSTSCAQWLSCPCGPRMTTSRRSAHLATPFWGNGETENDQRLSVVHFWLVAQRLASGCGNNNIFRQGSCAPSSRCLAQGSHLQPAKSLVLVAQQKHLDDSWWWMMNGQKETQVLRSYFLIL